jgi:hypothetical protein
MKDEWMSPLAAAAVAIALTVVPGCLLTLALAPRLRPLAHLAAAVPVSAGLTYSAGLWLTALDLSVRWAFVPAAVAVGFSLWRLTRHAMPALSWEPGRDLVAAAAGSGLFLATWFVGMRSWAAVPPHDDGYHHGYWVARIAATGSISPSAVGTIDPMSSQQVVQFYPLGTQLEAALVKVATGAQVPTVYNAVVLLGTAIALPAGLMVLTGRLRPDLLWAPAAAGLMGVAVPALGFAASWSGLFPQMVAIAAAPGAALLAERLLRRPDGPTLALAALGLAGLLGMHTTAGLFAAMVAAALVLPRPRRTRWADLLRGGLLWVSTCAVLVGPMIVLLAGGWSERQGVVPTQRVSLGESLGSLVLLREYVSGPAPLAFTVLAWTGLVLALRDRRMWSWVMLVGLMAALAVAAGVWPTRGVQLVTSPWYGMPARISPFLTALMVPLAACTVCAAHRAGRKPPGPLPALLAGSVVGAAVLGGLTAGASMIRTNYLSYSVVGPADLQAFRWLAQRVGPQERVLNGRADGSQWLYALAGVATTNWAKQSAPTGEAAERDWLTAHAASGWGNPRVAADLRRLNVRYAYVGDNFFPDTDNLLHGDQLAAAPSWRLAYSSGRARVFELRPPDAPT